MQHNIAVRNIYMDCRDFHLIAASKHFNDGALRKQ